MVGTSQTWNGLTFSLGVPGVNDVAQATGQTIALPSGSYSKVEFLATAVNGNQINQTFTVHYTDGTSTTFTQNISDWATPQGFTGESTVVAGTYRNTAAGGSSSGTFDVYGYSLAVDGSKTIASITLPNDKNVEVLSMSMVMPVFTT